MEGNLVLGVIALGISIISAAAAWATFYFSAKNLRRQIESARRIAEQQIIASSVAESRRQWGEAFRNDLAELKLITEDPGSLTLKKDITAAAREVFRENWKKIKEGTPILASTR